MYNNAGAKLKSIVSALTGIMMVAVILGSVALGILTADENAILAVSLSVLIALGGCAMVWLSNLVLAAFAELATDVHIMVNLMSDIADQTQELQNMAAERFAIKTEGNAAEETWECDACGQANSVRIDYCQLCGAYRDWKNRE